MTMRGRPPGPAATVSIAVLGTLVVGLLLVGPPGSTRSVAPAPPPSTASTVSAGGFDLTSTAITLPDDDSDTAFPDRPGVEQVTANCTACHSAEMILVQPNLTRDQWQKTIDKMRDLYRAPIADSDVPALLDYLAGLGATSATAPVAPGSAPAGSP